MSRNAEGEGHQSRTSAFGLVSFEDFISPMVLEHAWLFRHVVDYFARREERPEVPRREELWRRGGCNKKTNEKDSVVLVGVL